MDEGSSSKAEKRKFQDVLKSEFSWLIDDSNNCIMCCYVWRKAGPDIGGKTELVTGKKLKRDSPVYHNKTKSLKHEKCFNVVSEKTHSSTKYLIFCLIQGINNYVLEIYSMNYDK